MPVFFDISMQVAVDRLLLLEPVGLQLEEEVPLAEDVLELARGALGRLGPAAHDRLRDLAAQARRQADQPLRVLAQQRLVDARVVIEALEVAHRVQVREVLPADLVLGEQDQVIRPALGLVEPVGRDVRLAAEDRLHAVGLGALIEVERAEQVAVVGDRDRLHAALEHLREQLVQANRAVEKAILRVQMQVGELGHAAVSLALRARTDPAQKYPRFSTGRVARALALALALAGCAGGEPGTSPSRPRILTADPASIQISPHEAGVARFVLTHGLVPLAGQSVSFTIFDDPGVDGVEAQGATLPPDTTVVTDVSGVASLKVTAGLQARFFVIGRAGSAEDRVTVNVVEGLVGSVIVAPFFAPGSIVGADANDNRISTIRVRFFDRHQCRDYPLAHVPNTPLDMDVPAGSTARFDNISTTDPSAVYAQALGTQGTPVAAGCVDLPGPSVPANGVVQIALPMYDVVPDPIGTFAVTSWLRFEQPLAAAAVVAAPWRDLSDCPLDPAELLLDCTIDALTPPTPGDPHDCRPSTAPGGEGPLGEALRARRGDEIAGTRCRGPLTNRQVSLDAIVLGMFGAPKPALIAALPAISDDAAHVLDALELSSTLDVRAGAAANQYLITHTLTDARFTLSGGAADVPLAPLALPNLAADTAAITRDGLLVVDRHGFSLRLGRVARSGFGAAALEPRGSPPSAGGLVAAIAALASTDDRAVSGCAALDRVLCAEVKAAPGCLAAACPTGLSMLATALDSAFDAADGAGLDLYLSGSTPLIDMSSLGSADLLDKSDAHPVGVAAWTADVRTSLGVARITTKFKGVRQ